MQPPQVATENQSLRQAIRSGCNPGLMNSWLTDLSVYGCMLDFKVNLFLYSLHSFPVFHSVVACSLLNILSVLLETDPPDMRHIVRRD